VNTVLEAREASVRYLDAVEPPLVQKFDLLAGAPGGVARLRELILCLATAGRLAVTRGDQSHWQRLTLDQVGEWGSGGTPSKSHPEYYAGGTIPWLVIGDLNDGVVQSAATCISDLGLRNSSAKIVEPGTVLVAMYGSIGKLGVAGLRCATNQAIAFCRPNADVVTGDFLFLFLRSIRASLLQRGQGLAQQNISQKILRNIEISVPPLAEQARIVARVGELMQLCDALEAKGRLEAQQHARLLETLMGTLTDSTTPEELAANWQRVAEHFDLLLDRPEAVDVLEQTVLQLAVRGLLVPQDLTDEPATKLMDRVVSEKNLLVASGKIKRDKPLPPVTDDVCPHAIPEKWKWVRLGSVVSISTGKLDANAATAGGKFPFFTCSSTPLSIDSYSFDCSAVLLAGNGDFNLKMYSGKFDAYQRTYVIEPCLIELRFLYFFLKQGIERISSGQRGTAVPYLRLGDITESMFALPPLAEQSRIVDQIEKLLRDCAALRQRLAASQATQSRLAEALVEAATA
jgi:type I restriction enzyme S subunit